ncbi:MAG: Rnl2 family RNA ligase [Myxococcota bacterium]
MAFRTYPKMGRSVAHDATGGTWVATEKIHGAQLVAAVIGGEVRFGKRKDWLGDAPFFGWQLLAPGLIEPLRGVARALGAAEVWVYGELYGGAYPHPDVAAVPGLQAVQTGVWYAPDLRWSPFDLLVASGPDDPGELLAFHEIEALAAGVGLHTAPVVGRGPRAAMGGLPVSFATRVPALHGLPAIGDNLAEGLVIKPDARARAGQRPVYKRKIEAFEEARFGEAERWNPGELDAAALRLWIDRLVNGARLASARSKVGESADAVVEEVALDVAMDLEEVFGDAWARSDQEALLAYARERAAAALAGEE